MSTGEKKKYIQPMIATDIAILTVRDKEVQVLLIQMKQKPFNGKWALPGGLIKKEESLDEAAARILYDQTNVSAKDVYLQQLYAFGEVNRDPLGRVVSVAYFALVSSDKLFLRTNEAYAGVGWFSIYDLPSLAYDHSKMIEHALYRLRLKLRYSNIVYSLLPEEFTLTELQTIYEIILGKKMDKRNFRKKILALPILKDTSTKRSGEANRPAKLYSFKSRKHERVDIF